MTPPARLRPRLDRGVLVPVALLALAVALAAAVLAPAGGAAAAPAIQWRAEESPFRLEWSRGGAALVAQATHPEAGPGRSLGFRLDGTFHTATTVVSRRKLARGERFVLATTAPGRRIDLTVRRTPSGSVSVAWAPVPADGVDRVSERFSASPGEHFLGSGQRDGVDLRGTIVPLKVWNVCASNIPMPFVLSSAGWGLRLDSDAVGRLAFPGTSDEARHTCELGTSACALATAVDAVQVCLKAQRMAYELYAGTPEEIVGAHARAIGLPPLPSRSQFALIKWRDSVGGESELLDDIRRLRASRIPIGWVLLDNPWETNDCVGGLTFDPVRFPDPKGTIDRIHAEGVRFMLWISPYVQRGCTEEYAPHTLIGDGLIRAIDLTDRNAREEFERRIRALLRLGVDGFKGDRADEVDFEQQRIAAGFGTAFHNRMTYLYAASVTRLLREARGRDFATLFRAGSVGSQALLPGVWAADQASLFTGLRSAIRRAQSAGVSGYPFWGSDVGGYGAKRKQNVEVFVRWAQLGAVSPILEVGGEGRNARFWEFGKTAVEGLRRAAQLHYELHPYHYELARGAARTGLPILRPLAMHYPEDERAWAADLELLVGPDLLAAPVTLRGTAARVYLPAGAWVDLGTNTVVHGPRRLVRRTPLLELPLYLRAGAAIPFDRRLPIWEEPWGIEDLSRPGRAGWLVAPGPERTSARSTDYGRIDVRRDGSVLELVVRTRRPEVQVVLAGEKRPAEVRIDGAAPEPRSGLAALRGRASGWAIASPPFGGIVLKLDASDGVARATIRFR